MDKAELNAKLGYNRELLNQLSNAFDLQEDYNDYGWDKLFEICRYIYNLEQQCKKQKEVIDKAIEYINKYAWQEDIIGGIYTTTGKPATDRYMKLEWDNCNELLDILKEVE